MLPDYAELHALSNFSFQRGASHPQELVERAHALGYSALALTDECSVAGVVRAHVAARQLGLPLIVGSEFLWGELRIHRRRARVCRQRRLPGGCAVALGAAARLRTAAGAAPRGFYRCF